MDGPVIILAAPHSFTSIVCTMLGQHPQMYDLPEVNLFIAETMSERARQIGNQPSHQHGLLRLIAQLFAGEQTFQSIEAAQYWLNERENRACVSIFQEIARTIAPKIVVDKSPRTTMRVEYLQRAWRAFPKARFIHLLRHPQTHAESMEPWHRLRMINSYAELLEAYYYHIFVSARRWYTRNMNVLTFTNSLPEGHCIRIRGEDLLRYPDRYLLEVAEWLGLRADDQAISAMKRPDSSPYARFGPSNARFGNNRHFLSAPALRVISSQRTEPARLVNRRVDEWVFSPEIKELAKEFGYMWQSNFTPPPSLAEFNRLIIARTAHRQFQASARERRTGSSSRRGA